MTRFPKSRKRLKGFSLAELLITLLIIAEIATFSIPKIIYASQQQQKIAILKETIGTLSQLMYLGYTQGQITSGINGSYFMSNMNAVKLCPTNSTTEGCMTTGGSESNEPGMVLHNGAVIAGLNDNGGSFNGLIVDWNGSAGNNLQGDDQVYLYICYGTTSCTISGITIKPGAIAAAGGSNVTLYQTIFQ